MARAKRATQTKAERTREMVANMGPPQRIVLETNHVSLEAVAEKEPSVFENRAYRLTFRWRPRDLVGKNQQPVRGHFEYLLEVLEDRLPEVLS